MGKDHKPYARYFIVRGHQALWKGDPAEDGSPFRQVVITSNEFNSTQGTFQVYALENTGKGIQDGKLAISKGDPRVLFDQDFQGLNAAGEKFGLIIKEAISNGLSL